jgi:hypothetical protein
MGPNEVFWERERPTKKNFFCGRDVDKISGKVRQPNEFKKVKFVKRKGKKDHEWKTKKNS